MITANALAELARGATDAPWIVTSSGAVAGGRGVPRMVILDGSMDNDDRALLCALANNRDLLVAALRLAEAVEPYAKRHCFFPSTVICPDCLALGESLSAFRSAQVSK